MTSQQKEYETEKDESEKNVRERKESPEKESGKKSSDKKESEKKDLEKNESLMVSPMNIETKKKRYPRSVFFIVGNEFCERFSFYGMRAILVLYLKRVLSYSPNDATMIFHLWSSFCYFFAIFGAILSDSFLGKFKTIFYLSIVYAIGNITISTGSIPKAVSTMNVASLVGLVLIAMGTGGIKPCVSAFGGDQFGRDQEEDLKRFFSYFYISINLGSLFSTFITPILREDVHCFGDETCFPLAFGVPAVLMFLSLVLFLLGKPFYRNVPPEGNIVLKVSRCICHALSKKCAKGNEKKSHWLDYAEDKYDRKFIGDIKLVLHILVLYIPLPLFWALFNQQASTWVLQAERLDGNVLGFVIKPDQMQIVNPLLIIAFIPLFNYILYPLFEKCNCNKPLRKMTVGGLLAALAFLIAGFLEQKLEAEAPVLPAQGHSYLLVINNSPCTIAVNQTDIGELTAFQEKLVRDLNINDTITWSLKPRNCGDAKETTFDFAPSSSIESLMITVVDDKLQWLKTNDERSKPQKGEPQVRFFYNFGYKFKKGGNATIKISSDVHSYDFNPNVTEASAFGVTKYQAVDSAKYKVYLPVSETNYDAKPVGEFTFKVGGVYIVSLYKASSGNATVSSHSFTVVQPNKYSILLQLPQYIIITAGEIMFSITGLEFSYSQAPKSMKAVLQAGWLITTAVGDLLVVLSAEAKMKNLSYTFFIFAALMTVDMAIFGIMAHFYTYVKTTTASDETVDSAPQEKGNTNKAYETEAETEFSK